MNKKLFFFIPIAVVALILILVSLNTEDKYTGDNEVFEKFEKDTKNIRTNINSITRFDQDDIYYYHFSFTYELGEESGNSELIYVYKNKTKSISFFNMNDVEYYPNEYNAYLKASKNGSKKVFTISEFNSIIKDINA